MPCTVTVWSTSGDVSVVPCTSAMVLVSPGAWVSVGVGVGVGSGPVPGSVGNSAAADVFFGVSVADSVKSALFESVSAPFVRLRDLTSLLFAGAVAAAPSKVLDVP